jgi:hypothetical protein
MKALFYNMMPEDWKTPSQKGNLRMASMSLSQMSFYFNGSSKEFVRYEEEKQ